MVQAQGLEQIQQAFDQRFSGLGLAFRDTGGTVEPFQIRYPPFVPNDSDAVLWQQFGDKLGILARDGIFGPNSPIFKDAAIVDVDEGPYDPRDPLGMMDALGLAMEACGAWKIPVAIVSGSSNVFLGLRQRHPAFAKSPSEHYAEVYGGEISLERSQWIPEDEMFVIPAYPDKIWIEAPGGKVQVEIGPRGVHEGEPHDSFQACLGVGIGDGATIARIGLKQ